MFAPLCCVPVSLTDGWIAFADDAYQTTHGAVTLKFCSKPSHHCGFETELAEAVASTSIALPAPYVELEWMPPFAPIVTTPPATLTVPVEAHVPASEVPGKSSQTS